LGVNTLRSNGRVHSDRLTSTYYSIDILRLKDFSLYIGYNTTSSASHFNVNRQHIIAAGKALSRRARSKSLALALKIYTFYKKVPDLRILGRELGGSRQGDERHGGECPEVRGDGLQYVRARRPLPPSDPRLPVAHGHRF
jgi:hypothetical protein